MLSGFADESKNKSYVFAFVIVRQTELESTRRLLRDFVLPGQRSLHFSKESMSRRVRILNGILNANLDMGILDTGLKGHKEGRSAGLVGLCEIALESNLATLCLERDDSSFVSDQKILRRHLSQLSPNNSRKFEFRHRHEEPILWAADALAWSYQ